MKLIFSLFLCLATFFCQADRLAQANLNITIYHKTLGHINCFIQVSNHIVDYDSLRLCKYTNDLFIKLSNAKNQDSLEVFLDRIEFQFKSNGIHQRAFKLLNKNKLAYDQIGNVFIEEVIISTSGYSIYLPDRTDIKQWILLTPKRKITLFNGEYCDWLIFDFREEDDEDLFDEIKTSWTIDRELLETYDQAYDMHEYFENVDLKRLLKEKIIVVKNSRY